MDGSQIYTVSITTGTLELPRHAHNYEHMFGSVGICACFSTDYSLCECGIIQK